MPFGLESVLLDNVLDFPGHKINKGHAIDCEIRMENIRNRTVLFSDDQRRCGLNNSSQLLKWSKSIFVGIFAQVFLDTSESLPWLGKDGTS